MAGNFLDKKMGEGQMNMQGSSLSIIIPVFNEQDNLTPLHGGLVKVVETLHCEHEILFINDGSQDKSGEVLERIAVSNPAVIVIAFDRNYGQTAALVAGFKDSHGELIVTLDADGQNDPEDIPLLLAKLEEGFDVVCGWRKDRRDPFWRKRLPSLLANLLISKATGTPVHDFGCTLRAYRKSFIERLPLYGEMHRFIPAYAQWQGARIAEVAVRHHPRTAGSSKYGLSRIFKVILDLITLKFLEGYMTKPIYIFGAAGMVLITVGASMAGITVVLWWMGHRIDKGILFGMLVAITGLQLLMTGLLAEMFLRVRGTRDEVRYKIKKKTGGKEETQK